MILSSFPRIPHLPGSHTSPEDILLDDEEALRFLTRPVIVFEKLDGLNVSIEKISRGRIVYALKSEWNAAKAKGVARGLDIWIAQRKDALSDILDDGALYGEWMRHVVHVEYTQLSSMFLPFAFFRDGKGFLPFHELRERCRTVGLPVVTPRFEGVIKSMAALKRLVGKSAYGPNKMEGVILEDVDDASEFRWAKWVDGDYVHPAKGKVSGEKNALVTLGARRDRA